MYKFINKIIRKFIGGSKLFQKVIIDLFHLLYYNSSESTIRKTSWFGVPVAKCPMDSWIYQEIIYNLKPDIIIESGTSHGGGSLFFASLFDLINKGKVISIDVIKSDDRPQHKRIEYILGSSTSKETIEKVKKLIQNGEKILVILDSLHDKKHVLDELRIYSEFVSLESYIVVEDTNVNNHPVLPNYGPGPMEAVMDFLKENKSFKIDKTKEKFYMTFNPNGFLKKVK